MPDIEQTFKNSDCLYMKIIGESYFRLNIDRIHRERKPRVVIHQDALGDLIITVDNNRIYDEREK